MTSTGLWVRLGAGTTAALGSIVLIPVPGPAKTSSVGAAALAGCLAGVVLFSGLARTIPRVRLAGWSRRDSTRSSFFVIWAGVEETLWRRLTLGGLAVHAGWPAGLVGSTVAFAVTHRVGKASHLVTGFAFGAIYLVTGQLLASIVMHAVYNLLLDRALSVPPATPT